MEFCVFVYFYFYFVDLRGKKGGGKTSHFGGGGWAANAQERATGRKSSVGGGRGRSGRDRLTVGLDGRKER